MEILPGSRKEERMRFAGDWGKPPLHCWPRRGIVAGRKAPKGGKAEDEAMNSPSGLHTFCMLFRERYGERAH